MLSRSNSRILVVGHGGCGKSTELRMLASALRESSMPSITIEAREDLDLNNFSFIDILMLIVERLTQYARDQKLRVNKRIISAFHAALSTTITQEYWEDNAEVSAESGLSATIPLPIFLSFISKVTASFKIGSSYKEELRRELDPRKKEIINALNALIDEVNASIAKKNVSAKMVIIIDGLEKCHSENAKKLFRDDISALTSINTHLIIACPINIYHSPIANTLQSYFDKSVIMPMIKTHYRESITDRYDEGIAVIKQLILKRVDTACFEEGVLENIIVMAGGSLRDTCSLVRDSAFEAYMRGENTVNASSAEYVMTRFATDVFYRAGSEDYPMIKKIFEGEREPRNDDSLSNLLLGGVVFEYNGEGWIDLHPLMRQYLEKRPKILEDQEA
jgi:nucleoside-triphosphatase THEP1